MNKTIELYWKKRFNESALNFVSESDIGLWSQHGFERRFNTFFKIFQKEFFQGKRILDIGCGSGAYTIQLKNQGCNVMGIDFAEHVIKKAVEKSNGKIPYIIGALPSLPFKKKTFDVALCIGIFQSIDDCSPAITDIRNVLKDRGEILLMTLNSCSIRSLYKNTMGLLVHKNNIMIQDKRHNPSKLKHIFKKQGFDTIRIINIYIFPKMLIPLENLFQKSRIFLILDKMPLISLLIAHAFIIRAVKSDK